jgi:hypothetical protein
LARVKAGDRLVSINGEKNFDDLSAEDILRSSAMRGSVYLVFLGFVGKLHAEVRLATNHRLCGIPVHHDVVVPSPSSLPFEVHGETIFNAGVASLLFAVSAGEEDPDADKVPMSIFEVRRTEASRCLNFALSQRLGPAVVREDWHNHMHSTRPAGDHGTVVSHGEDEKWSLELLGVLDMVPGYGDTSSGHRDVGIEESMLLEGGREDWRSPISPSPSMLAAVEECRPSDRNYVSRLLTPRKTPKNVRAAQQSSPPHAVSFGPHACRKTEPCDDPDESLMTDAKEHITSPRSSDQI